MESYILVYEDDACAGYYKSGSRVNNPPCDCCGTLHSFGMERERESYARRLVRRPPAWG